MSEQFKSEAFEVVHHSARALFGLGLIDKATLRDFDKACFVPPAIIDPEQIRALREQCQVSQGVFARLLNISSSTVQKWESGAKRPSGVALKLLDVVSKHGLDVLA